MTDDFVISIHALERFEERFPDIWTDDEDIGLLIYQETMDALEAGRVASVPPIELSTYDLGRWGAGKAQVAWVPDKTRGYVLVEGEGGLTVATVLEGQTKEQAKSRLYVTDKNLNWRDTKENGEPPKTDAATPRPVWARHLQRTLRSFEEMDAPTEDEKRDAIKVLADVGNSSVHGLWLEAHRILDEAG